MSQATTNIYILKLKNNKYYVGQSTNMNQRIKQHEQGEGSAWTQKYAPVEVVEVRKNASPFDEDKITKEYMAKYGVDNVRGGSYSQVHLTDEQEDVLQKEIDTATGACFKCGEKGHFANHCQDSYEEVEFEVDEWDDDESDDSFEFELKDRSSFKKNTYITNRTTTNTRCFRCGRTSHYANECYATTSVKKDSRSSSGSVKCYSCGRYGHYASSCWR